MSDRGEKLDKISKRRGFFWPSAEIYGGVSGFYDYGHLGTRVKRKLEDLWRSYFLKNPNFQEIETSTILPEEVLKASGHVDSFTDPITKCKQCGATHRADEILEEELDESFEGMSEEKLTEIIKEHGIKCSTCGGDLEEVGTINLMFPVEIGPHSDKKGYLRPETAQGSYINFLREFRCMRKKMPMGLATVGKSYRNEISPRKGVYRTREFTQAELQIFLKEEWMDEHDKFDEVEDYDLRLLPVGEDEVREKRAEELDLPERYVYWMARIQKFFLEQLGLPRDKFRFRELSEEERSFYNRYHWDIELDVEAFGGFGEVAGIHYRTDHDLKAHGEDSDKDQRIHYRGEKFVPHVLELSFGIDRCFYSLLELNLEDEDRTFLSLPREVAPYEIAVFPLMKKKGLPEKAQKVFGLLQDKFDVFYDESGSIGKRYARQDEIGTKFCLTIDFDTLEEDTLTIRDRDSTDQIRVSVEELEDCLDEMLNRGKSFSEMK